MCEAGVLGLKLNATSAAELGDLQAERSGAVDDAAQAAVHHHHELVLGARVEVLGGDVGVSGAQGGGQAFAPVERRRHLLEALGLELLDFLPEPLLIGHGLHIADQDGGFVECPDLLGHLDIGGLGFDWRREAERRGRCCRRDFPSYGKCTRASHIRCAAPCTGRSPCAERPVRGRPGPEP